MISVGVEILQLGAAALGRGRGEILQLILFLCLYSWLSRHFSPFYSPQAKPPVPNMAPKLIGWLEGFISLRLYMILKHRHFKLFNT